MRPGTFSVVLVKVLESDLSQGAKNAYAAIGTFAYKDCSEVGATEDQIARRYNVTARTFQRHLGDLVKVGLVALRRWGRNNAYLLLDPDQADYSILAEKHTTAVSPIDKKHTTAVSPIEKEKTTAVSPKHTTELSCGTEPILLKASKRSTKKAVSRMSADSSSGKDKTDLPKTFAARFLKSLNFNLKDRLKLLRKYPAGRILEVKRCFEIKAARGYPKNPRGLVLTMLRDDDISVPESRAAAAQACESYEVHKREIEEKKADRDIIAWLNKQPDKQELLKRAEKDVRFRAGGKGNGKRLNKAMVETLVKGYLQRERNKREREKRLEVPSLAAATG